MEITSSLARVLNPRPMDIYGAWSELALYAGTEFRFPRGGRPLHWQHGWHPGWTNFDPDLIIGENGMAARQKAEGFFVGREDQAEALRGHGFMSVRAIGLPFVYAMKNVRNRAVRKPGSLLVVPGGHSTDEDTAREWSGDLAYIDFLGPIASDFSDIKVMLHGADFKLGRDLNWLSSGYDVLRGADYFDPTSLSRLAKIFSETETVTTNELGSHVVYAASAGCRVSVDGPTPPSNFSELNDRTLYKNRPDLILAQEMVEKSWNEALSSAGLFTSPSQAKKHLVWGQEEIGWKYCLERNEVVSALHQVGTFPLNSALNLVRRIPLVYRASKRAESVIRKYQRWND